MQAVSYIHVDCDLYTGAIQALTLLTDRIHPGTVIVFDELINYPNFRDHEVKALWEWSLSSGRRVKPIAVMAPFQGEQAVDLDPAIGFAVSDPLSAQVCRAACACAVGVAM
jgi:hypothetical protein